MGFDEDDLTKWLGSEVQEGLCDPDEVPEPPDEAITKPGDLWILGEHRLLYSDSSKPEEVITETSLEKDGFTERPRKVWNCELTTIICCRAGGNIIVS